MASNTAPNATCKTCSELYTDPRMLPCLHSFCKKCLQKLLEEQGAGQTLKCPTCNNNVPIPTGGIDAIPQDIRASNEANIQGYEAKITSASNTSCDRCIDTSNGPSVSFCCNCCEFLCKVCSEDHKRWRKTLTHELVEVGEGKKESQIHAIPPKHLSCGQHPDENLKFFCKTCETLICRDCIVLEHNGHTYNRIEKIAEKEKADLLASIGDAETAKSSIENAMAQREKITQQVQARKKAVDDTISSGFKQLYAALHSREEALLAKSTEVSIGKTSALAIQNEELKRMRDEIADTCQLISGAAQSYTPNEILSTKKLMKAKLQALLQRFHGYSLELTETDFMPTSLDVVPLVSQVAALGMVSGGSCPSRSTASNFIPRATVNTVRNIVITARDEAGITVTYSGEIIKGVLSLMGSTNPPVKGETTDNGDGTYMISLTPTTTGEHELAVSINGQPIKRSPFVISVNQARVYTSLSCQQNYNTALTPWDVAVHDDGDLYVAAYGAHSIYVLSQTGSHKTTIGCNGSGQGQFYSPSAIAIHGDVIYVAEDRNKRVQKLTTAGTYISYFGEGQLSNPRGICVDPQGRLFVSDYSNNRVQVFEADGSHAYSITGSSSDGSSFANPWGIAFDDAGNLHVVAHGSQCVRIFTPEGKYITSYGSISVPAGIAINEQGYSFITEYQQYNPRSGYLGKLHIFDPTHQLIESISAFNYPAGVAIDKNGYIFVADSTNNQVQKY